MNTAKQEFYKHPDINIMDNNNQTDDKLLLDNKHESHYQNIIHPDEIKFHVNTKRAHKTTQKQSSDFLSTDQGNKRSTIPSLISPSRHLLNTNESNNNSRMRHERRKRRSPKYRGTDMFYGFN